MIGELSEKGIHKGLKNYLEPNKSKQEVKVGKFIADIRNEEGIIEIQTKQFKKLVTKLDYYLENNISVMVVYPLEVIRTIVKLDENGRLIYKRKAPHKGVKQDILYEAYWILDYLDNPLFTLSIIEVETKDYRNKDNVKLNKELISIGNQYIYFNSKSFVDDMLPYTGRFSKKDVYKTGIKRNKLNPLKGFRIKNLIKEVGKQGNLIIFEKNRIKGIDKVNNM